MVSAALRSFSGDFHLLTDISGDFSKASQCQSPPSFVVQIEHPTERERERERARLRESALTAVYCAGHNRNACKLELSGLPTRFDSEALSLNLHGLNEAKKTKRDFILCTLLCFTYIISIS